MKLTKVDIHKFKCFESEQSFDVEKDVTVLVGMNESGKTSLLEAVAKTNYFQDDPAFKFNLTHDFPRKEKKKVDKSGEDPKAVTSTYSLDQSFINQINDDLGADAFSANSVSVTHKYSGRRTFGGVSVDSEKVLNAIHPTLPSRLNGLTTVAELNSLAEEEEDDGVKQAIHSAARFYENKWNWNDPIGEYVARKWVNASLPKFLYYDEYYALPSRISIEDLQAEKLQSEELKTAKALFDLADINIDELVNSDDFEDFKAELEATEATITEELFEFWSTNRNLEIKFDIDKKEKAVNANQARIVEHILDIRVRNHRAKISLPLKNRSKGFNWFFSFLVWFKKIQEDQDSSYILLLDEPGLNLHASAQADLLNFIESLAGDYQIMFTTHSPFMVAADKLHRVRTVLETDDGSQVSESLQEKDPNTLFPLQAALGYDIAQNLYISKKNLLVEGVSDLIYLEVVSSLLDAAGRSSLSDDITIVPVGGMEKIATFVSLLRGSKLSVVCLLDSTVGQSGQAKLDRLIGDKIIKSQRVLHYRDHLNGVSEADVEDLFDPQDYLKLFNGAFSEHSDLSTSDLSKVSKGRIVEKINSHLGVKRFNHYRPANYLAKESGKGVELGSNTLDHFEAVIKAVNEAMKK